MYVVEVATAFVLIVRQIAISHQRIEICKFLLQMNADPFLEDQSQWYELPG
jgi:hypothetical protein